MKEVRVRFFASFREAAGVELETVNTSANSAGELFTEMTRRFEGLSHEPAALVAINDEMTNWQAVLKDGDEVLFFPPVAGG